MLQQTARGKATPPGGQGHPALPGRRTVGWVAFSAPLMAPAHESETSNPARAATKRLILAAQSLPGTWGSIQAKWGSF